MDRSKSQNGREERLIELLADVREEIDRVVRRREIFAAVVRAYVVREIELLVMDKTLEAKQKLHLAYKELCRRGAQDDLEDFYEAVSAFDLGFFAYSLKLYFDDFEWIAKQIWQERGRFMPCLDEAFAAARFFVFNLNSGDKPEKALYYALKRPNNMSSVFGYSFFHGIKPIGEIFGGATYIKLKEILRAYVREHSRGFWD